MLFDFGVGSCRHSEIGGDTLKNVKVDIPMVE
jgi:hypothetical protein